MEGRFVNAIAKQTEIEYSGKNVALDTLERYALLE